MQLKKRIGFILITMLVFSTLILTGCTKKNETADDIVNEETNSQEDTIQTEDNTASSTENSTENSAENSTESSSDADKENVTSDATGKLALSVGDATINLDELMYYIYSIEDEGNYYDQMYQSYYGMGYWDTEQEEGVTMRDVAKDYVMDTAVMYEILYDKAIEAGYTLTEEETATCVSNSDQIYEVLTVDQLKVSGLMKDVLVKVYEKMTLAEKYYTFITEGLGIDEKAITENINKEDYKQYDTKCLYVANTKYDESNNSVEMTEEEKEKAKNSIENALKKVKAGEDFDTIVGGDETVLTNDITFVSGDQTVATEYEDAAVALSVGNNSEIVETTDGYYIIQLVDDSSTESYDTAVADAISAAETEGFDKEFEVMKKDYEVKINNEVWDTIVMGDTTTIKAE